MTRPVKSDNSSAPRNTSHVARVDLQSTAEIPNPPPYQQEIPPTPASIQADGVEHEVLLADRTDPTNTGDLQELIDGLNHDLAGEYQAVVMYTKLLGETHRPVPP